MESAKVGKRGAIVVPAKLRRRFGIEEGAVVTAEEREDGILIRPAVVVPIESTPPSAKQSFFSPMPPILRITARREQKSRSSV
jgi:AbrB family looped-hinge helix DNA binding protein